MKLPGSQKTKTILLILLVIIAVCILIKTMLDNRGIVICNCINNLIVK